MQPKIIKEPDWLYLPAAIDHEHIPGIQQQLLIFCRYVTDQPANLKQRGTYQYSDWQKFFDMNPLLLGYLKKWKIHIFFNHVMIIWSDHSNPPFEIHRDYNDPAVCSVGLNFPVLNCEGTYTKWYDATVMDQMIELPDSVVGTVRPRPYVPVDVATAVEIARVESNLPYWVNNFRPHKGESLHDKERILVSLRFSPTIHHILHTDYFIKTCSK
jgi:hypothetical protein